MDVRSILAADYSGPGDLNKHAITSNETREASHPQNQFTEHSGSVAVAQQAAEEVETLQGSIKAGTVAQIVVAIIAMIGLIYLLKLVLVTTLASILLAYVLEPAVARLMRLRVPRAVGALITVCAALVLAVGISYFSYNRV